MRKRSIRFYILYAFIAVVILTGGIISYNFFRGSSKAILDLSDRITKEVSDKVIERTSNFLNTPATYTQVISRLVDRPDVIEIKQMLWKVMWELMQVTPYVQSVFVADTAGSYVQVRREPRPATRIIDRSGEKPIEHWFYRDADYRIIETKSKTPTFDPRVRPWYLKTKPVLQNYWTDVYVFTTAKTPGISVTYPVTDQTGRLTAVACINTPLHSLSEFLSEQHVSESGIVLMMNENGEIMAHPDPSLTSRKDPATGKLRLGHIRDLSQKWVIDAYETHKKTGQKRFVYTSDKKRYLANFVEFPVSLASNWRVAVIVPEADLLGPIWRMGNQALLITLFILFVSSAVVYFIAKKIAKPIMALAKQTEQIKDFHLDDVHLVSSNIKEVDIMSRSLDTATKGLRAFRKYVPADLVRNLIRSGRPVRLGGEKMELTILFSDIEDFTTISETLPPDNLLRQLSEYMSGLTDVIMDHDGTIDKYIGDAVMAFWGAPVAKPLSPHSACRAALACQKRIAALNAGWEKENKPVMKTRIGIHTGEVIVGNIGSEKRMNYTITGGNVNLAHRLQEINKSYGTGIIISENTYEQIGDEFICRSLDVIPLKGEKNGLRIYELIDVRMIPKYVRISAN